MPLPLNGAMNPLTSCLCGPLWSPAVPLHGLPRNKPTGVNLSRVSCTQSFCNNCPPQTQHHIHSTPFASAHHIFPLRLSSHLVILQHKTCIKLHPKFEISYSRQKRRLYSVVLPYAVIGLLVVYCLKGVNLTNPSFWLPAAVATMCVILLHVWKGNVLLSIGAGTIIYMFLVQMVLH